MEKDEQTTADGAKASQNANATVKESTLSVIDSPLKANGTDKAGTPNVIEVLLKANGTDQEVAPNHLEALVKANTSVAVWLVFLALGGGLLALYYSNISYMPDIEWTSSIIYLAVASFIGGGVALVFVLSLFVPGFLWATFLVSDPELTSVFCYNESRKEPCLRSIWRHLGQPFVVVLVISHILLLVCLIASATYYALLALVPLMLSAIFMWLRFRRLLSTPHPRRNGDMARMLRTISRWLTFRWLPFRSQRFRLLRLRWLRLRKSKSKAMGKGRQKNQEPERHRRLFKYTFWFAISVLLSQISMLLVYLLSKKPVWSSFVILTFICTGGVLVAALVVAERYSQHPSHALIASLVIALVLLVAADRFSSLSNQIMAVYGFGGNHKVNFLLKPEGGKIIKDLGLINTCTQPAGDNQQAEDKLCGVEILSMMGNEYYLRLGERTFTLPKEVVTSRDSGEAPKKQ